MIQLFILEYFIIHVFRLEPQYASAHNNIGTLLDNRTEAEYHFREALNIAPSHPGAHINLGNLLM